MLSPCRSSREISDATLIPPCDFSIFAQLCYVTGTFASSGCEPGCAVSRGPDRIQLSLESLDQHLAGWTCDRYRSSPRSGPRLQPTSLGDALRCPSASSAENSALKPDRSVTSRRGSAVGGALSSKIRFGPPRGWPTSPTSRQVSRQRSGRLTIRGSTEPCRQDDSFNGPVGASGVGWRLIGCPAVLSPRL